ATSNDNFLDPGASTSGFVDYTVPGNWNDVDADDDIYGWLRTAATVPAADQGKDLALTGWNFDDADWTYWNGQFLGHETDYAHPRSYVVPGAQVKADDVVAIRGLDVTGSGGITAAAPQLQIANPSVTITGSVTDSSGKPLGGIEVDAFAENTPWGPQDVSTE